MKKTVSWHTETLKQEKTQDDANQTSAKPPKRSSSAAAAPAAVTNPQVNARIQQMVAMQRAQNASMRQLMSNNSDYGGTAASPSGLRDLVTTTSLPQRTHAESAKTTASSATTRDDASPTSARNYMAPMKPPATLPAENSRNMDRDTNINYQGPQKHSLPPNQRATPSPIQQGTPPFLYPKYPYSEGHDSPVSYNSVLDQNLTPSKVRERKQAQRQLQTIQSQQQMELKKSESVEASSSIPLQPSPTSKLEAVDWGSMQPTTDGYTMKPIQQHSDYGALSSTLTSNNGPTIKETMAKPVASFPQARPMQQEPLQQYKPASDQLPLMDNNGAAHTQHQFHYGDNPPQMPHSYHDSSNIPHSLMGKDIHFPMGDIELRELQQRSRRRRRNLLCQILCYPIQCLFTSEQVGRSFCFGAIDGMLTGSGILAAYIGLGILSHVNAFGTTDTSSYEADMHRKWILVALTLAACFSDGVCMAIGHVWSTRLVAGASFEERKEELRSFETSRSDAKARLVDALLLKGMLKIDAMSLADTLEGYPDLFVSALLGEGFCGASAAQPSSMGGFGSGAGGAGGGGMIRVPSGNSSNKPVYNPIPAEWNIPAPAYAPGVMGHEGLKFESYSEFSDLHQDPDVKTFSEIMSESHLESFFMMVSFGSFSVIPSLVYTFAPYIANALGVANGRNMDTLAISVSVGVTSIVMFLLGAWKSQFYNSNWCMYGVETVGVFAVCVVCAFLVGMGTGSVINSNYH
mmetsp:Transcript_9589/g.19281  ORF Transcript_9589/g.19281 Transcript_9589/m.19281 type:complete len:744 (+) Transcript_9589:80-2311(+)